MIPLRPYQTAGVEQIRAALRDHSRAPLYVLPTGGGKTIMFAEIARAAAARHTRVLILVHRREILGQTLSKLAAMGVTSGQVTSNMPMTADGIQCGMVFTVARRLAYLRRPDLIIQDEAHHVTSDNTWGRVLRYWGEVPRLGFTATPERLDGRGLGESFDRLVEGPSMRQLITDGYLSAPVIYRPPVEVSARYHVKRGDFDIEEQEKTMSARRIVGDVIEHYRRHMDGQPAICFCVSVDHSHLMAEQFRAAGYTAAAVWGNMPDIGRERALRGLADGEVQVITSCDLISEGFDTPAVSGCIMLRRTMSLGLYLQQAGRALRPYPGKTRAVILDHAGNYHLHGHLMEEREWSLDASKRDGKQKVPATVTCPRCYGVWPGRPLACPDCGFRFTDAPAREEKPVKTIAGELVEAVPGLGAGEAESLAQFLARALKMEPSARQKAMWAQAYKMSGQGDEGRRKLDALRAGIGYKKGWTHFIWSEVQKRRA